MSDKRRRLRRRDAQPATRRFRDDSSAFFVCDTPAGIVGSAVCICARTTQHSPQILTSSTPSQTDHLKRRIQMSSDNLSGYVPSIPVIKVHLMMPNASSSRDSTFVSIKYSKTTTAQEVIDHIKKKKARFPHASESRHLAHLFAAITRSSI